MAQRSLTELLNRGSKAAKINKAKSKPNPRATKTAAAKKTTAKSKKLGTPKAKKKSTKDAEQEYQDKLKRVMADLDKPGPPPFLIFTTNKAKEYGLHNRRFATAKSYLVKRNYLVLKGSRYHVRKAVEAA